jgi:hypothetical protein
MSEHIVALVLAAAKRPFIEHANLKSGELKQHRMLHDGICGILRLRPCRGSRRRGLCAPSE